MLRRLVLLLAVVATGLVAREVVPEVTRYLKIRKM